MNISSFIIPLKTIRALIDVCHITPGTILLELIVIPPKNNPPRENAMQTPQENPRE
jgi:hypothetical protein